MRSRLTKSLGTLAATLALAGAALATTAPQASAGIGPICRAQTGVYLACFTMQTRRPALGWKVNFHLDVYGKPHAYAEALASCGRNNPLLFKAQLWGDDGGGSRDHWLGVQAVADPTWPRADPFTLMTLFTWDESWGTFDEDPGTDRDEIYAKFSYTDCHTGLMYTFRTDNVVGDFR